MSMEISKRIPVSRRISPLGVFCLCLCCVTSSAVQPSRRGELPTSFGRPVVPHDYLRAADVAQQCRSVLSSGAELTADGPMVQDLHFANGDWRQDAGHAPLMPFPGTASGDVGAGTELATPLATFMLTHADTVQRQRARRSLNVSGVLTLTISRNCCCSDDKSEMMDPHSGRRPSPEFKLLPRIAKLKILLEGVYTEAGGGERVLCMVGNAPLPMRGGGGGGNTTEGPWDWAKNIGDGSNNFDLPVVADDNIVLILRYPKAQTLTTRAVHGEMMSTSAKSDSVYFDTVRLVSQFGGPYASYRFRPEEEDTTGCSTSPLFFCDDDVAGGCAGDLHEDVPFCDILRANEHGVLAVVPNWNCDSTDEFCGRLGPFVNTTDRAFTGFAIVMQGVRCEPTSGLDGKAAVLVSAVFRAMPPWEDQETAVKRAGLSGMTLSAEGVWRVSTGRLCMTACLGTGTGTGKAACQHRVSLYIPTTFSITRRGILMGQITSMDGSHFPLSFHRALHPRQAWNKAGGSDEWVRMTYSYNKVEQAMELLWRTKPSRISSNLAAMSLISYPRKRAHGDTASLSQDLQLRFRVVPKLHPVPEWIIKGQSSERFFELQIFSIGPLVSYVPRQQQERWQDQDGVEQRQELVNVSAVLTESGGVFGWRPVMSLEGVYNPEDGRMHLVGCRDVEAPWQVMSKMSDLESGMDCSIELQVEYPPTKMRWLFSPSAKVYMSSTRAAGDPLHFNRTELPALQSFYPGTRFDGFVGQNVGGIVCLAMLSATIVAAMSQLRYMDSHPDVVPYISLAMLGAQALCYSAVLVTDAMILPAWPRMYDGDGNYRTHVRRLHWDMDCSIKALALAALLLTLRLARKVRRSRVRARARTPLEPGRVPRDGAGLHLGGLLFVLAVHWLLATYGGASTKQPPHVAYTMQAQGQGGFYSRPSYNMAAIVERCISLAREWFLLPQVMGNAVWRVNCRPLRKSYYAGITGMSLLPHVYGFLRPPPAVDMYPVPEEAQDGAMDLYPKVGGVVVPLVAAALAFLVYVQQRWNYRILGWVIVGKEKNKMQHVY
uniref:RING-type E3 ubiquitin transferase n=2 Tax=Aegilops tauschii subsp. strangulata TaxID=200361 RepID=A0A453JME8_AEGTS